MTGADVAIVQVTKRFGATVAVDDLSLRMPPGSLTALLGPSGCGKSTTLSLLAGLQHPDSGDVRVDGVSVLAVSAERRAVALVVQKPLLFPHLSVAQNVGFGLRMARVDRRRRSRLVAEMLDRVQLPELADRRVGELSGGQEQRVALARALVLQPRVLLLDEPFSQLDTGLRVQMRALVRRLHDESDVTTLFVTHDQVEAVEVADTIALMQQGRLAGHGEPETFYQRPPSLDAARFFGVTNELPGCVQGGRFCSRTGLTLPTDLPNGEAVLVVRPERMEMVDHRGPDTLAGVVTSARFAGSHIAVDVEIEPGRTLTAHVPVGATIALGSGVHLCLPPSACTLFGAGGRA